MICTRSLPVLPAATLAACLLASVNAQAAPLIITFEATASGELDGIPFTDEAFVVTATGDTDDRFPFFNGFSIPSTLTQITFAGLNGGNPIDISNPISINVNTEFDGLTLSNEAPQFQTDFVLFFDPQIDGYELLGPFGPISGDGFLNRFGTPLETSAGVLEFESGDSTVTVTVIPEPSSLALLGLGGLLVIRRRKPAC